MSAIFSLRNKLLQAAGFTCFMILGSLCLHGTANAFYSNSRLIDNNLFINSQAMAQPEIQSFLNDKGSYLRNHSYKEVCDNAYMTANYGNCGKTVLASQIIYDSGKAYGLSQKTILATLQKEQSLITDPSPAASQINYAMGYGCPDSGSCSHAGFFTQIDWGTWQLRLNYARANGDNNWIGTVGDPSFYSYACPGKTRYYSTGLYPGRDVTFYDDYKTAYTHFVIANAATASLYCYTPHAYPGSSKQYYSGSYWFVYYYAQWWGNPATDTSRDKPLVGDWDGDGKSTPGIKRGNMYYFDNDNDGIEDVSFAFGRSTDTTLVGDWDGDGKDEIGLKRDKTFFFDYDNNGVADDAFSYGKADDVPLVGDWDGDGKTTIGLQRGKAFYLDNSADGMTDASFSYGKASDIALVGDWDGDDKDEIGLKRGRSYFLNYDNDGAAELAFTYGSPTDLTRVGDWDDDGKDEIGLRRDKTYFLDYNNNGVADVTFTSGRDTDKVIIGDWDGDGKDGIGLKRDSNYFLDNDNDGTPDESFLYMY
jgi:hypothetical protein